jgi:hypothetical protein
MEQVMQSLRYHHETKRLGGRKPHGKNPARSVDFEHDQTIRAVIAEVDHSIMALDRSIEIEQELSGVYDRSHHAYPMTARAMEKRRDNLKTTRDALAERLSSLTGSKLNQAVAAA